MSIFNNCSTRKQQGDLGEARAIYELTRIGYLLSKPLVESCPYDLIGEKDGVLFRISVKTSGQEPRPGSFSVQLYTSGGNTKNITRKPPEHHKYEFVFVLTSDNRCWLIPSNLLANKGTIQVGPSTNQFNNFQL